MPHWWALVVPNVAVSCWTNTKGRKFILKSSCRAFWSFCVSQVERIEKECWQKKLGFLCYIGTGGFQNGGGFFLK